MGVYAGGRSWSGGWFQLLRSCWGHGDVPLISFSLSSWEGEDGQAVDIQKYMYVHVTCENYGIMYRNIQRQLAVDKLHVATCTVH